MHDEPLKCLLVAGRFEVRGSCGYSLRLLEHLPAYGVEPHLVCSSSARVPAVKRSRLPIRELRFLTTPVLSRLAVRQVCEQWEDDPPDLVHAQTRMVAQAGMRIAEALEVPYIITVHDIPLKGQRFRFNPQWGRAIVAVSSAVRDELVGVAGVPSELVHVIPSGVEVEPSTVSPAKTPANPVPVVGSAGPLETVKGHAHFLRAAAAVLSAGWDVEFMLAGTGPEEAHLRSLARDLEIADHVTFVPHVQEYGEVLQAIDVFCLPSLQQGLGVVMLEAMAHGKPVVAAAVGGVQSVVVDGETGLLVPPGDSEKLAARIVELLQNPERAKSLGRNGRRLVSERFGVQRMVEATAQLYRRVLGLSDNSAAAFSVVG